MVRPADYRRAVGYLQAEHQMSERRACRALGFCRASAQYRPRREAPVDLIAKLRELAARRPRWGYRRLHILLRREGIAVNHKRVYRLYRQEGLKAGRLPSLRRLLRSLCCKERRKSTASFARRFGRRC